MLLDPRQDRRISRRSSRNRGVIRMLAQTGDMAILLVEQYYDFGQALADHYMVMSRGKS